jgi:hypothetical protein
MADAADAEGEWSGNKPPDESEVEPAPPLERERTLVGNGAIFFRATIPSSITCSSTGATRGKRERNVVVTSSGSCLPRRAEVGRASPPPRQPIVMAQPSIDSVSATRQKTKGQVNTHTEMKNKKEMVQIKRVE